MTSKSQYVSVRYSFLLRTEFLIPSSSGDECVVFQTSHWRPIRIDIGEEFPIAGANAVHSVCKPLADNQITIFYVSSYSNDYVLLPQSELEHALDVLQAKYHICVDVYEPTNSIENSSKDETPPSNILPGKSLSRFESHDLPGNIKFEHQLYVLSQVRWLAYTQVSQFHDSVFLR